MLPDGDDWRLIEAHCPRDIAAVAEALPAVDTSVLVDALSSPLSVTKLDVEREGGE